MGAVKEDIVVVGGKHYRLATWPRRIAARVLDIVFLAGVCVFFGKTLLPFMVLLSIVYLLFGDGLLAGRNIGKCFTGLKVIDMRHGCAITPLQDFLRHRVSSLLDGSQGYFDTPEIYVVNAGPLPPEEIPQEKPATLDLEAMRKSMERPKQQP